jgi:hypothetical protein
MLQRNCIGGATAFRETVQIETFQLNYPQRTVHRS